MANCFFQIMEKHSRSTYNGAVLYYECYACQQVGVPIFHSTSCDLATARQPHWQALAGSSLIPIHTRTKYPFGNRPRKPPQPFGSVLDPRSQLVQWWNRVFLLARGISLAVDPLFFYALTLSIGKGGAPCLYVDNDVAAAVTVVRTCLDAVQFWHVWLQFRLAYVSKESLVFGCGKLVWDARAIASHYAKSLKGFWFDVFVILPFPQAMFWLLVPRLISQEKIKLVLMLILLTFLFQFLPKLYHSFCLMTRMKKVTGYIFGTIWWGFALNLIAYLIASHVIGGCWYVLATQSVVKCLKQECERNGSCKLSVSCFKGVCYQFMYPEDKFGNPCGNTTKLIAKPLCLDDEGPFNHGIYSEGLLVVTSNSLAVRILYPIFWGLLNLSSFGNELAPTSNLLEVMFSIFIVLCGLTLFTLMIGNIQVFLAVMLAKNKDMQLKRRDMEWWMSRRQLPSNLRRRMRHFDSQRWAIMGGDDDDKWIDELPEGLRRDIKRFLCLDLIKKAPLFHNLDDLVLDNICDRVKPLIFCKGEKIIREGDPVQRMYFIVRGRVKRSQSLSKGMTGTSLIEPGEFLGDELLSWSLRRPFRDRLPSSSATFVCQDSTEAFGLDAKHLRYITDHFRYTFASERLKRKMRYYSSNWRTWAAVNIQFAWNRHRMRSRGVLNIVNIHGDFENRLRRYASMFLSIRPHDHLE
ncbi:cyclic nucleotide-gated ion channel 2-like [Mercurialis annua]|uniref:cyclic nucleotide-gated ion channel 2-like n=1 Tax=Mercurialis annua TaxID=3986 RepID=UPI0021608067|nr:cyclic nucleotide-gated ion channel 2-like [Mercurialis annua]XP_050228942.1 cyclic nucleotide-gated ion channel 2-like [Mercurialis annua]